MSDANEPGRGGIEASRRQLLAGAATALAVGGAIAGARAEAADAKPAPQTALTPDEALAEILAGNARFAAGAPTAHLHDLEIVRARATEGQWPTVAVLACADSRVPVEMLFDEPIGRLFVVRIAGNVTTPEVIGSLEYAVAVLDIKAIVVVGHSSCGAVRAAMHNSEVPGQISSLYPALLPAVYLSKSDDPIVVTKENAVIQAATLINASPVIEAKVKAGALKVVPMLYDVGTGKVETLPIPAAFRLAK